MTTLKDYGRETGRYEEMTEFGTLIEYSVRANGATLKRCLYPDGTKTKWMLAAYRRPNHLTANAPHLN